VSECEFPILPKVTQKGPQGRRSGILLDPLLPGPVASEVAEIDERGRIRFPPRITDKISWFREGIFDCLMVFENKGQLFLLSWTAADQILQRRREIIAQAESNPSLLLAVQALEDRYHRLSIPDDKRPHLGSNALLHLGITAPLPWRVYLFASPEKLEIVSSEARSVIFADVMKYLKDLP
jgi:hypothetical protein